MREDRSSVVQMEADLILVWLELQILSLSAVHILGVEIRQEDFLRHQLLVPEWSLHLVVLQDLCHRW